MNAVDNLFSISAIVLSVPGLIYLIALFYLATNQKVSESTRNFAHITIRLGVMPPRALLLCLGLQLAAIGLLYVVGLPKTSMVCLVGFLVYCIVHIASICVTGSDKTGAVA